MEFWGTMRVPVLILLSSALGANAQVLLNASASGGAVRILNSDQAVLEAGENRDDLPCSVVSAKPVLGFDLRFHSGYEVSVPLRELSGSENLLTILFRVSSLEPVGPPVYFVHRMKVPPIEDEAKGDAYFQGGFDLGEGKYKVEWLMRDRTERVCSSFWEIESSLPVKDKQVSLSLSPGMIRQSEREQFRDEPPIQRVAEEPPLNVKVLVNFAPQNSRSATLQPLDTSALTAILRNISREPRIGKFTIVAFNLQEHRVVYRQDNAEKIDFPALGEAIDSISPGTIDLNRLSQKHGETEFLTKLIHDEVASADSADAVVFAGPKALLEESVPAESLRQIGELGYPVFYMNYNLYPQAVPWNDAIGKAVKVLKGYEYTISKPRDLWYAVTEMVSRIVKTKQGRRSGTSSSE
jgi:hypothetical protein